MTNSSFLREKFFPTSFLIGAFFIISFMVFPKIVFSYYAPQPFFPGYPALSFYPWRQPIGVSAPNMNWSFPYQQIRYQQTPYNSINFASSNRNGNWSAQNSFYQGFSNWFMNYPNHLSQNITSPYLGNQFNSWQNMLGTFSPSGPYTPGLQNPFNRLATLCVIVDMEA